MRDFYSTECNNLLSATGIRKIVKTETTFNVRILTLKPLALVIIKSIILGLKVRRIMPRLSSLDIKSYNQTYG